MEKRSFTRAEAYRGFVLSTIVFMMVFAATAVPIPLYAEYQATIGLTTADLAATMVLYQVGVVVVLLVAGRLSDALGRKPVTMFTVVLGIVGCLLFLGAQNAFMVLFGRFVQGISAGFAMSAVSTLVVDCIAEHNMGIGSAIASCGCLTGIMLGSVGVSVLYDVTPDPLVLYGTMIAILVLCLLLMPRVPEPVEKKASLRAATRFKIFIPKNARRLFAMTAVMYIVTWGVTCFFQAYSATIAAEIFDAKTPLLGSIILALVLAPSVLGGPMTARLRSQTALRLGIILFTAATFVLAWAIIFQEEAVFLVCCFVDALASGICITTALRMTLMSVGPFETSAIIASVNLTAYAGSAVMSCITGALLDIGNYPLVFTVLGVLGAASIAVVYYITWQNAGGHNAGELTRLVFKAVTFGKEHIHMPQSSRAGAFSLSAKAFQSTPDPKDVTPEASEAEDVDLDELEEAFVL